MNKLSMNTTFSSAIFYVGALLSSVCAVFSAYMIRMYVPAKGVEPMHAKIFLEECPLGVVLVAIFFIITIGFMTSRKRSKLISLLILVGSLLAPCIVNLYLAKLLLE